MDNNYKEWSLQYIFDIVVDHLRVQNEKSMCVVPGLLHTKCAYRGDDGLKCAAGFLIPDDQASKYEQWNYKAIYDHPFFQDNFDDYQRAFISGLQYIHDSCYPEFWEERFKEVARQYSLKHSPKGEHYVNV